MNIIGLLDQPTSGCVIIDGQEVGRLADDEKARLRGRKIGFVFQAYNLLSRNSALENVGLPLAYAGLPRSERVRKGLRALEVVGLRNRAEHFPSQLSGGEQQRVAIARALVGAPSIILADEPTGALDSGTGAEILKLLRALNQSGQTVIVISHDPRVAAQCERVVRLNDGLVVDDTRLTTASAPMGAAA
jgi:putative ABC transport system ATP-binding protein